MANAGLLIAAPHSGAGKTLVTFALLRALKDAGLAISAAKCGPDYIDPKFHEAAVGIQSVNLDGWAMDTDGLRHRAAAQPGEVLLIEGAMGVLDGAGPGATGSAADVASALGVPVVLVIDGSRQAASAVLPAVGLRALRPGLSIAGVILNRVASERHDRLLRAAFERSHIPVLATLRRDPSLTLPERHLGLVQSQELDDLDETIARAARMLGETMDLEILAERFTRMHRPEKRPCPLPSLGRRVAIAHDRAFSFAYPHILDDWRAAGMEPCFFSPLADEPPDADADAVYLPGGYPELHADRLAKASVFKSGLRDAATRGVRIFGECGGYMVLGDSLIDANGEQREMAGLLPLTTSFAHRKLHLGYRKLTPVDGSPWPFALAGHEFHYATIVSEGAGQRLFAMTDTFGDRLDDAGLAIENVSGSFAHVIAPWPH